MRLVAWNANYNNHQRRSLEETSALLESLDADILVLSEVAQPDADNPLHAQWFGETNPGLAVIARDGLCLKAHPANAGAPAITAGFEVSGDLRFNLVAAWPVPGRLSYHKVLMAALERYADIFVGTPAFLAGDLNSSTRVLEQSRSHPAFVERAHSIGLVSAYHFQTGEAHGEETVATYRHSEAKEFHLDYCFVSSRLAERSTLKVLRGDEWSVQSDHYPVVVDVPDEALRPQLA